MNRENNNDDYGYTNPNQSSEEKKNSGKIPPIVTSLNNDPFPTRYISLDQAQKFEDYKENKNSEPLHFKPEDKNSLQFYTIPMQKEAEEEMPLIVTSSNDDPLPPNLLEQFMREEDPHWPQHLPSHQWHRIAHHTNQILDNSYIRRKTSYVLFGGIIFLIVWLVYKHYHGDRHLRDQFFGPSYSNADAHDRLVWTELTFGFLFFIVALATLITSHVIGRYHDAKFDRRANRQLINYLIKENYLLDANDAPEFSQNIRILCRWLPNYFKVLLSNYDATAVIAVILNVAQYIVDNEIAAKIKAYQPENYPSQDVQLHDLPSRSSSSIINFEALTYEEKLDRLNRKLASKFTHAVEDLKKTGASTTTQESVHSTVVLGKETRMLFEEHTARIERLEALFRTTQQSTSSSLLAPEFVQAFALLLMREFSRLVKLTPHSVSPRSRATALSEMLRDTFLQSQNSLREQLLPVYFELFNITPKTSQKDLEKIKHTVANDDAITLTHLSMNERRQFIGEKYTPQAINLLVNRAIAAHQRKIENQPNDAKNAQEEVDLPKEIYNLFNLNLTRAQIFARLYPESMGILLSRLISTPLPNPDYISLALKIIWSYAIIAGVRKKIIFTIGQYSILKTCEIFTSKDPHIKAVMKTVDAHLILKDLIRKYLDHAAHYMQQHYLLQNKINAAQNMHENSFSYRAGLCWFRLTKKNRQDGNPHDLTTAYDQTRSDEIRALIQQQNKFSAPFKLVRTEIIQTIGLLFNFNADQLNHPSIQQIFIDFLLFIPECNRLGLLIDYNHIASVCNQIFLQFFGEPKQFNLKYATHLLLLCEFANVKILFEKLKTDTRDGFLEKKQRAQHRLAAALVYAYYQAGKPSIRLVCSQRNNGLAISAQAGIQEVLKAINLESCEDIPKEAFTTLGISQDMGKIIDTALNPREISESKENLLNNSNSTYNGYHTFE